MSLDTILWLTGFFAEAGVVLLCIRGGLFSRRPIFSSYIAWSMVIDLFLYCLNVYHPSSYYRAYISQLVVDAAFQYAVLVELGWSVLQPIRSSLPKQSIFILALLITIGGAVIWPMAAWTLPQNLGASARFYLHLQQTIAALRVTIFLGLAAFSQMLSIGWRNRELQIATGLGFYSMVSLSVSVIHAHQAVGAQYYMLDQLMTASYDCTLMYWIFSFSKAEVERQDFSPGMQRALLAMAGATQSARISVSERPGTGSGKRHNP